ncbi:MAG: dTDP-4-dehydrorhamnose reductase [Candidatus Thermoplasmatota archaeon]|nr:dTDP-4-dehydrorhamnose reductase [Candidatus Thermoplasmatota archaeon]
MKVLLTGGSGLFGRAFVKVIENKTSYDIRPIYSKNPIKSKNAVFLDITNKENVERIIKKLQPDVIVHAAAFTNVDKCEIEKEKAYNVNVAGTKNIAMASKEINAKMVYISTDYVFDGKKGLYKEEDGTNPINYYGLTKLGGEKAVQEICDDFVIARTSVVYGANKKNFATWVIEELKKGKEIRIVTDQWNSPTLNIDLAEQILALIEKDEKGIYHSAGGEKINRHDFVSKMAKIFSLDENLIIPATTKEMNWIAKRPMDSSLNVSKISKIKKPYKVRKALHLLEKEIQ